MRMLFLLFLSLGVFADNEIYIDQTGDNGAIDIEQLGSSNMIGGLDSISGQMTAAILNGGSWTFDINQIGSSNKFLTDGIYGDSFVGFFEFDGDSNELVFSMDPTGLNSADFGDIQFNVTGNSNLFDVDIAENESSDYIDIDWTVLGDDNDFTVDIDSDYFTSFIDLIGSTNTFNLTKTGYGSSSSDGGYFYLDLTGDSNQLSVTQSSTLAADWLMVTGNASNSNICIVQDDNGLATSC